MKNLLLLSAVLFALSSPVDAMTEESNHYNGTDTRSQYADPDDAEEQFSDAPTGNYQGQSGREQVLLNGDSSAHGQTYGFGSYDNGSVSGFVGSSPSLYNGFR